MLILTLMIRPAYENIGMLLAVASFDMHPLSCALASGPQLTYRNPLGVFSKMQRVFDDFLQERALFSHLPAQLVLDVDSVPVLACWVLGA